MTLQKQSRAVLWALATIIGIFATIALLIGGWQLLSRIIRGPEKRYCKGPRVKWRWLWWPLHWFRVSRCGYDLSAHLEHRENNPNGYSLLPIRCPECWAESDNAHDLSWRSGGWRMFRVGVVLSAVAVGMVYWQMQGDDPARSAPTWFLMNSELIFDEDSPAVFSTELHRRHRAGEFDNDQQSDFAYVLARALRSDNVKWNAHRAMQELKSLGVLAADALEESLDSDDWQERQLAAHLLQSIRVKNHQLPSDRLLEVTVEGLINDTLPWGENVMVPNARLGVRFLGMFPVQARPFLVQALQWDDPQARLLAAYTLGATGQITTVDAAATVLIEHLRDNDIGGDARIAMAGLAGFGEPAVPHLEQYVQDRDDQLRIAARWLIWKLAPPDADGKKPRQPPVPDISVMGPLNVHIEYLQMPNFR